jgi:hypothetical protein
MEGLVNFSSCPTDYGEYHLAFPGFPGLRKGKATPGMIIFFTKERQLKQSFNYPFKTPPVTNKLAHR